MRAARIDANQVEIVDALRKVGCTVQHLHKVGQGCPDILVGVYRNGERVNLLLEIKDGSKPPSARKLTGPQEKWHSGWRGQVVIVKTVQEALEFVL